MANTKTAKAKSKTRKAPKKGMKGKNAKVSKPLKRAIKAIARAEQETKYVAEYISQNVGVTAGTAAVPACLKRMIPTIAQGTADSERIGEKIMPTHAKLQLTVHWQATPTGSIAGPQSDLDCHVLILAVKGARNAAAVGVTPPNTLLKNGAGGNFDPLVGSVSQSAFLENVNHCPVNTEQFTVLKRMTHRFAKGDYDVNGPASGTGSSQKCFQPACHTFTHMWKPPTLDYNSALDTLPTNHYPVYVIWCTATDGGSYGGNLYYGARAELYYKDA